MLQPSRRLFVAGLGSAGLAAAGRGFALADCTNPAPGSAPVDDAPSFGGTPVARKSAYELTDPEIARLRLAYGKMQALPASDVRRMEMQRLIHAWYCATCAAGVTDIHASWSFLAWHRAFLYYHERILGSLVNDMTLRIPYWDWDRGDRRALPPAYAAAGTNPLNHPRGLLAGQSIPASIPQFPSFNLNDTVKLVGDGFTKFGGGPVGGGALNSGAHGYIHTMTGRGLNLTGNGDMGYLDTAAADPVFFAHHANVDRFWSSWQALHGAVGGAFDAQTFTFYDETKRWVRITSSLLDGDASLGYHYQTLIKPPSRVNFRTVPIALLMSPVRVNPNPPDPAARRAILESAEARIAIDTIQLPAGAEGPVVLSVQQGNKTEPLTTLFIVPHSRSAAHRHGFATTVDAQTTHAAANLLAQPGASLLIKPTAPSASAARRAGRLSAGNANALPGVTQAIPVGAQGVTLQIRS